MHAAVCATLNFLFGGYCDCALRDQCALSKQRLAKPLRNLLSRQQNSSASFLFLLRRNIDVREFYEKFPLTPWYSMKIGRNKLASGVAHSPAQARIIHWMELGGLTISAAESGNSVRPDSLEGIAALHFAPA